MTRAQRGRGYAEWVDSGVGKGLNFEISGALASGRGPYSDQAERRGSNFP